ncbi:MAG TPA: ABC transporter ATP-binding protein, partial [Candidatus Saccharimonadales bacterium]|nr:ABC transporter ATP-binding protein [Candidatus Saccharimonadales bacterium]
MNKAVYKNLLQTHWSHRGYWFGVAAELIRSFVFRVWIVIILAEIATQLAAGNIEATRVHIISLVVVYVAGVLIGTIGEYSAVKAENHEYENLSVAFYRKLTGKDMAFYRDHQTGYLVSLHRQYLDGTMALTRFFRGKAIRTGMALTAPTIILIAINWQLGLIALIVVALQMAYVVWASAQGNKYRVLSHEAYRRVTAEVSDEITNIVAFKSSGMQDKAQSKIAALAAQETYSFMKRRLTNIKFDVPREIITILGMAAALLFAITLSTATVGLIVITMSYMLLIMRTVNEIPDLLVEHDDLITKIHPTLPYFSQQHETVADPKQPKKLRIAHGTITLDNLGFSYPGTGGKTVPVFKNLTLTIKGGQHIGIVGVSGAGKSTLAGLLMRFDDVTEGSITIDGIDIRDVRQADLHRHIAYVPQEPLLFHRTIRENIAYFNNSASEADI